MKEAREVLRIAKTLISYRGGPIRTDRNFVKDIAEKIEWVMEDQNKRYDIGGSLYGEPDDPHTGYRGGLTIEGAGFVTVQIPLKDLYRYVDIPMKEFGYRLKSDLNKIVKELNKDGLTLWVEVPAAENYRDYLRGVKVDKAKIQGSNLLIKMDDYSIDEKINDVIPDIERHMEESQY